MPMQAQKEGEGKAPTHLQPQSWKWVGGEHHTLATLAPEKSQYSQYRRLGAPRDQSG